MSTRSPWCAALLSLVVPGIGQLYNGDRTKALAVLLMVAGIAMGILMATVGPPAFHSILTTLILGVAYLFIWGPTVVDAYQRASGHPATVLSGEKPWYVIFMLLTVGPMAIPLLWQSPRFSRTAKVVWSALILLLAIAGIAVLLIVGPAVEKPFHELQDAYQTLQFQ